MDFTHFNDQGHATMVDVSEKGESQRTAVAEGWVYVSRTTVDLIKKKKKKKGDVLTVAQIAGIMGAKRTPDLIPMCHPLILTGVDLSLSVVEELNAVRIEATVKTKAVTGVEMEALTAVSVAALTVYDMCKAVDKGMVIGPTYLVEKTGGKNGDFKRD